MMKEKIKKISETVIWAFICFLFYSDISLAFFRAILFALVVRILIKRNL